MYEVETSYEEFIKREQQKYPELDLNDIETLKEKVQANKDLPAIRDKMLVMFLHACYFKVDAAYKMIVVHYKYRRELRDVFTTYDPASEEMKRAFECVTICPVTNVEMGRKERIIVTNFKKTDHKMYDYVESCRYFVMMLEYTMATHGTFDGLIIVMNGKGLNWRHIYKTPMNQFKKLLGFVQEALPLRLKEVNVLNAGSVITMLFNVIKPFMNNGLMEKVTIYPENSDDIFEKLPIELMPKEIGGTGKSHFDLNEDMYKLMVSSRDWYLSLEN